MFLVVNSVIRGRKSAAIINTRIRSVGTDFRVKEHCLGRSLSSLNLIWFYIMLVFLQRVLSIITRMFHVSDCLVKWTPHESKLGKAKRLALGTYALDTGLLPVTANTRKARLGQQLEQLKGVWVNDLGGVLLDYKA